ncbi:MAG: HAMP domain-containing protein [Acidimicrobiales bacterium]
MTRRLLLSYLGLAVLILVVLEVPFGFIAARHEADTARAQATRDATEIAIGSTEVLESGNQRGLQALVEDYFSRTGAEVAIADAGGRLIAADDPDRDGDVIDHEALLEQAVRGRTVSLLAHDEGHPTAASAVPIGSAQRPLGAVLIIVAVSAYTDRSQDVWIALAGFGLAVLVLTTLVGLGLARSLTRPLAVLEGTVARFGGGDLSSRVPPGLARSPSTAWPSASRSWSPSSHASSPTRPTSSARRSPPCACGWRTSRPSSTSRRERPWRPPAGKCSA